MKSMSTRSGVLNLATNYLSDLGQGLARWIERHNTSSFSMAQCDFRRAIDNTHCSRRILNRYACSSGISRWLDDCSNLTLDNIEALTSEEVERPEGGLNVSFVK